MVNNALAIQHEAVYKDGYRHVPSILYGDLISLIANKICPKWRKMPL